MAMLEIPQTLYDRVKRLADDEHRSVVDKVVDILDRAISNEARQQRDAAILDRIRANRIPFQPGTPTAEEMIREDRER